MDIPGTQDRYRVMVKDAVQGPRFQAYKRKQDEAAVPPASSAWAGAQVEAEPVKQFLHCDPAFGGKPVPA